jgi:hypothetical protein
LVIALAVAIRFRATHPDVPWPERLALERISRLVAPGSVVVSAGDPLYVYFMLHFDESIDVVPLSRRTGYAARYVSPRRTDDPRPKPRGAWDRSCVGLLRDGNSQMIFPIVADENPEWLAEECRRGRRLYVHTQTRSQEDGESLKMLGSRFTCRRLTPDLYELSLPPVHGVEIGQGVPP